MNRWMTILAALALAVFGEARAQDHAALSEGLAESTRVIQVQTAEQRRRGQETGPWRKGPDLGPARDLAAALTRPGAAFSAPSIETKELFALRDGLFGDKIRVLITTDGSAALSSGAALVASGEMTGGPFGLGQERVLTMRRPNGTVVVVDERLLAQALGVILAAR